MFLLDFYGSIRLNSIPFFSDLSSWFYQLLFSILIGDSQPAQPADHFFGQT